MLLNFMSTFSYEVHHGLSIKKCRVCYWFEYSTFNHFTCLV